MRAWTTSSDAALHLSLFVVVSPCGLRVLHRVGKQAAMRRRGQRVAAAKPTPTHGAPDELIGVKHLL